MVSERDFKLYRADKHQLSEQLDELAKTPSGRQRYMQVNPTWNYYKAKVKATLSSDEGKAIYRRRKFDVEPVFGHMKRVLAYAELIYADNGLWKMTLG